MAHTLTAASSMRLSNDRSTEDRFGMMAYDQWEMSLAAMPLTPPSSFDELPHLAGTGHRGPHSKDRRQCFEDSYSLPRYAKFVHGSVSMNKMTDDAQLFEHALTALRQDQKTYQNEEARSRNLDIRTKPRKDSVIQKSQPARKTQSRVQNAQTTKKAVRPPALAATHPSLYKASTPPRKQQSQNMLPTPPPEPQHEVKIKTTAKVMPPSAHRTPSAPWKVYTDPNKLISAEPQFDDPMYRMLKIDVNPDQPNVVSPLFMIGMPCGSLVEAANYYGDDATCA